MPDVNTLGQPTTGRRVCWLTDHQPMDDNRANILVARNGRWFGSAGGRVFNDTMDLHGTALVGDMNAARGACGQDGTIGFWIGYPSGGDVQLVAMDATVHTIPDAYPQGNGTFAILDRFTAWWQDGHGQERTTGMLLPVMLPGDKHNRNLFRHQGRIWVAYQSSALSAIVTHPEDSLEGYVVATVTHQEPQFYLMARETAQGVVLCTSWNAEDHPRDGVLLDFDAPRVNLLTLIDTPKPDPTPVPEPEPDPTPEPDPMEWNTAPEHMARKVAELVIQEHPAAWEAAHAHGSHDRTYMDLVAGYLHFGWPKHGIPADPKWGENGKRGTDEKSEDILNYKNPAVPKLGLESYDFFRASMPEAGIVWNNITDPDGAGAKFITPPKPPASGDPIPSPDPTPTPVPSDLAALTAKVVAMDKRLAELERRPSSSVHGKKFLLVSHEGKYGSVQPDGSVVFDRTEPGGWEEITILEVR